MQRSFSTPTTHSTSSSSSSRSISSCGIRYAEQLGRYVFDELLSTEQQYCEDLANGIGRYTPIFQPESELPEGLRGQQHVLLSNVTQIAALHRHKLLPLMLQHRQELDVLLERWLTLIERGHFNCYVLYTASQRESLRLYDTHELYFKRLQITLGDPLGIRSFLLKPVQRITKYPLLLDRLITTFFAHRQLISKRMFELTCRLEKRLRELLERANQVDQLNDIKHFNAFNVLSEANFIMVGEFQMHDGLLRRTYQSKLFVFNICIVYTERKGRKHLVRGKFVLPDVCFVAKAKSFVLCDKLHECEFICQQSATLDKWETIMHKLLNDEQTTTTTTKTCDDSCDKRQSKEGKETQTKVANGIVKKEEDDETIESTKRFSDQGAMAAIDEATAVDGTSTMGRKALEIARKWRTHRSTDSTHSTWY
ncbi:triple functional domain protein-like [Drosophila albomicans]|uniref:Triple functional domain protein-like n=1 Tax=Drosophila albomicans TaxID=7291 RepID=A0A6P8ZFK9_DROAB|nr:triple functional domain protein-like [Drosophila albomicans]